MSRGFKIALIVLVLMLEAHCLPISHKPSHRGIVGNDSYRQTQRFAAFTDYQDRTSAETKAAFDREMALLRRHVNRQWYLGLAALIVADGVAIYYFLPPGDTTPAA